LPKAALRRELVAARAALSPADRAERAALAAARLLAFPPLLQARTVGAYAPLGAELDPAPAVEGLRARGARIVYPRVRPGTRVLAFAEAEPAALVKGPLGVLEPPPGSPGLEASALDALLIPGVAFSLDGLRLGRGGGYYDATLAAAPHAVRAALAFELQVVAALPAEAHDARVDALATEARLLLFPRANLG
jgi:5-formyltetrahydrofolate cyclo-ligase